MFILLRSNWPSDPTAFSITDSRSEAVAERDLGAARPLPRYSAPLRARSLAAFRQLYHHWGHDLWELVPTPQKARRVRKSSVAEVLKRNRFDADQALAILRQTPVTVQDGAVAAAIAHIETNECVALGSGSRFARPE